MGFSEMPSESFPISSFPDQKPSDKRTIVRCLPVKKPRLSWAFLLRSEQLPPSTAATPGINNFASIFFVIIRFQYGIY